MTVLAIDGAGAKHSGAATVLKAIVAASLRSGRVDRVVAFTSPRSLRDFDLPTSPKLVEIESKLSERGPPGRIAWQVHHLGQQVRASGSDALLCLSGGGFGGSGCPSTLFVQQSLPFSSEALSRLGRLQRLRMSAILQVMAYSAARSACLIVQTPTMRDWVVRGLGVSRWRVRVVEPDVTLPAARTAHPALESMREAARGPGALLYVGNSSPYKNLEVIPEAMRRLLQLRSGITLFGTFPTGHPVIGSAGVRALPHLDHGALREAYELASALVMPSLVETVGLPMLESALVGTPVVAADRPYAHDVCGESALYFDPLDPADLAAKLHRILEDANLRVRLTNLGHRNVELRASKKPYDRMVELALEAAEGVSQ